jgi:hypothetical protein
MHALLEEPPSVPAYEICGYGQPRIAQQLILYGRVPQHPSYSTKTTWHSKISSMHLTEHLFGVVSAMDVVERGGGVYLAMDGSWGGRHRRRRRSGPSVFVVEVR